MSDPCYQKFLARFGRFTSCLVLVWLGSSVSLNGNPPPSEWQIITPVAAGGATGSAYFPLQNAFDATPAWDANASEVTGAAGAAWGPGYTNRHGYIDFGPNYDEIHIMETWTRYRTFSGGSHPGYVEMWWDDDKDTVNDSGLTETRLNFNNAQGMPHLETELWFRDKRVNELGGAIPKKRYLIIKSSGTYADRAQEYAIVGYLYDGLVPPEYVDALFVTIDNNTVQENGEWQQAVGTITLTGGVDGETYRLELDSSSGDNEAFQLIGHTLWTARSFDFEAKAAYTLTIDAVAASDNSRTSMELVIQIADQTGAFDTNGPATAAVAAAYPEINEGDFVIWNATNSSGPQIYYNNNTSFNISYPNKILIKGGKYSQIVLNLKGVNGTDAARRVPISNFQGQVYANEIGLSNGNYWRLTGQYDPALGLGDPDFPGCDGPESDTQFDFSNGRYGIWARNEWVNEYDSMVYVSGTANGWEIDHIEVSDGGFAGMLLKKDSGTVDMDEVYLHHLYIHDTGSEGIYLGSTQSDPQHQFNDLLIENILIVRAGTEAIQVGQLGNNCVIQNSVFWGAMDWLSPFNRYQDNTAQVRARQGNVTFRNNVLLGGGEKFFNASVSPKTGIVPSGLPLAFKNNVMWGCHGPYGAHQSRNTDNTTPWIWEGNFWGGYVYSYDIVYPTVVDSKNCILMASNGTTVSVINNVHDSSRDRAVQRWASGTSELIESGNVEKIVLAPRFLNLLGTNHDFDILKWTRWTATVGEDATFPGGTATNKGSPVTFHEGDIVQHDNDKSTRFYRCLQTNSQHEPPLAGDSTWELLIWTSPDGRHQFCPPDDARLVEGSLYHQLGMGFGAGQAYDADTDDLPDDWEQRHGLDTQTNDKTDDPDRDGRSNWDEFLEGTDPQQADQGPAIAIRVDDTNYMLDWAPPAGRAWKYQYSLDLDKWFDLTTFSSSDSEPIYSALRGSSMCFYRTRISDESSLDLMP